MEQVKEHDNDMMIAVHEGTTYVASQSLQETIKMLESEMYILRQALKWTRWIIWGGFGLFCVLGGIYVLIKWNVIITFLRTILGV